MVNVFAGMRLTSLIFVGICTSLFVFFSTCCGEKVGEPGVQIYAAGRETIDEASFVKAIIDGNNNTIQRALDLQVDPNAKNRFGDTALIWAVFRDRKPLVETLLKRGANPNIAGTYQKAPLHWAAEHNIVHQMELLARSGAKIDIYDKRFRTPLHFAVEKGHLEAIRFLLKHGADPNWVNGADETPLYLAIKGDKPYAVELLVLAGADPKKTSSTGLSPLAYAIKTDRQRYFQTPAIKQVKKDIASQIREKIKTVEVNLDTRPEIRLRAFAELLHQFVNEARTEAGLVALNYEAGLEKIALAHCRDMVTRKFFDHVNPSKENPLHRAQKSGFEPPVFAGGERVGFGIGENIYQSVIYRSRSANVSGGIRYMEYHWLTPRELARQVVNGWMESPGHRQNILNPEFTHEGFGMAVKNYKIWVTQNFYFPMGLSEIIDGRKEKPEYHLERIARTVHESVNRMRVENGRPLLVWDEALVTIAHSHGEDMVMRGFFEHLNPEKEDVTARAKRIGYPLLGRRKRGKFRKLGLGENLSMGRVYEGRSTSTLGETRILDYNWMSEQAIVAKAIEEWWNSPGHRANMLNRDYERSGVAVVIDNDDQIFIVHNFF